MSRTFENLVKNYEDKGYAELKADVADALIEELTPIQDKVKELLKDKKYLESIYKEGAQKASYVANKTLRKVQKKVGMIPR